jgi:hypothetical protein
MGAGSPAFFVPARREENFPCCLNQPRAHRSVRPVKAIEYKSMLNAVEKALQICDDSSGFMDEVHRKICEELRVVRARLLRAMESLPDTEAP